MKGAMIVMVGTLLAVLVGCQSDMTGPNPSYGSDATPTASPTDPHPDVAVGDAYFEETIGRYDLRGN